MAKSKNKSTSRGRGKRLVIPDHAVGEFNGMNTYISDLAQLQDGESPDSLNWITGTQKDHIELRGGYALLGTNRNSGVGRITGLAVGQMTNGTQVPFFTFGEKVMYYDASSNTTKEVSTPNILGTAANGEDVAIMPYQNLAGSFVYLTSPDSSIIKIAVANPATAVDLLSTAYRGLAKIDNNRMFMWQRKDIVGTPYNTQLFLGVSDKSTTSQYTQTTGDSVGTGDGTTKSFTGTITVPATVNGAAQSLFAVEIAAPTGGGVAITGITAAVQAVVSVSNTSSFSVGQAILINGVSGMTQINNVIGIIEAITANTNITLSINSSTFSAYISGGNIFPCEYFIDDQNGNLNSINGGTGTVNYQNGAVTIKFHTAPVLGQNIYAQFYSEDSTSGGIADFTQNGSVVGQGKTFNQFDGGGTLEAVWPFDQVQYCFHQLKTWYLNLTTDDTNASNLPYRSTFGVPYWRAAFPTPDGILILDNAQPSQPKVQFLEISPSVAALITIIPTSISDQLNLSPFGFGQCAVRRFGTWDIICFQDVTNGVVDTVNTLMFIRDIYSGQWDLLDYAISCMDTFNGQLLGGDSLSNNVYTLFSGFDDDGTLIDNHWTSKAFLFAEGLKKCNRFVLRGLIQQSQKINVNFATDFGNFVTLFTVAGNGSYVNLGNPVTVGSSSVGSQVIGGGGGQGAPIIAYPYEVEFIIGTDIFEYIQVQFQATNIGYCSIDEFIFKDIRWKASRVTPSRTATF